MAYKVIQWATGHVGIHALRGIAQHPDLELVGLWVSSAAKAGRDAGELCGIGKTGVIATRRRRRADRHAGRLRLVHGGDRLSARRRDRGHVPHPRLGQEPGHHLVRAADLSVAHDSGVRAPDRGGLPAGAARPSSARASIPASRPTRCRSCSRSLSERIDSIRAQEIFNYATYDQPQTLFEVMGFGKPPGTMVPLLIPGALTHRVGAVGAHGRRRARRRAGRDPPALRAGSGAGDVRDLLRPHRARHRRGAALRGLGHGRRQAGDHRRARHPLARRPGAATGRRASGRAPTASRSKACRRCAAICRSASTATITTSTAASPAPCAWSTPSRPSATPTPGLKTWLDLPLFAGRKALKA